MRALLARAVLSAVYFALVTPAAVVCRLRGRSPLPMEVDRSRASYWSALTLDSADRRLYGGRPPRWLLPLAILSCAVLAPASEEAELPADLYVVF